MTHSVIHLKLFTSLLYINCISILKNNKSNSTFFFKKKRMTKNVKEQRKLSCPRFMNMENLSALVLYVENIFQNTHIIRYEIWDLPCLLTILIPIDL